MAHYAYKNVLGLIPKDFIASWISKNGELNYEANYDGDLWDLTADYIEHLQELLND